MNKAELIQVILNDENSGVELKGVLSYLALPQRTNNS